MLADLPARKRWGGGLMIPPGRGQGDLNVGSLLEWRDPDDPAGNVDRGGKMPLRSGAGAGRIRGTGPALLSPVKDLGQEGEEEHAAWQQEYEDDRHHLG